MPFQILPATELDIPAIILVSHSAFETDPYHHALCPGGLKPSAVRVCVERTIQEWRETPQQRIIKAVDIDTNTIIGYSVWNFYDKERSREEWDQPVNVDWCEGQTKHNAELFISTSQTIRYRIWEGRKYYYEVCAILAIHQDYQRKGAGGLLMNWALTQADELGLPAYLEASEEGVPLYRKLGFSIIESEKIIHRAEDWDGDRDMHYSPMMRMGKVTSA